MKIRQALPLLFLVGSFLLPFAFSNQSKDDSPVFVGTYQEITPEICKEKMSYSWRDDSPVPLSDLRLFELSHWGFDGKVHQGELVMHMAVADDIIDIFRQLFEIKFPIQRMHLVDKYKASDNDSIEENNCYAHCARKVARTDDWSNHAYGTAIDINPQQNPYYEPMHNKMYICPEESEYLIYEENRKTGAPGLITRDSEIYKIFKEKGWVWGGECFDYCTDLHHFQKIIPELNQVRNIQENDSSKKRVFDSLQKMIICTNVADLRSLSVKSNPITPLAAMDPLQSSQLLFGDHIEAIREEDGWLFVNVLGQKAFSHGKWNPIQGWIKKKQAMPVDEFPNNNLVVCAPWAKIYTESRQPLFSVSCGTKLKAVQLLGAWWEIQLPSGALATINGLLVEHELENIAQFQKSPQNTRRQIINAARLFLEMPYMWGGRSAHREEMMEYQKTGVDCSGLVNLCYEAAGFVNVPRNSRCQYKKCTKLDHGGKLNEADLIFLAHSDNSNHITHVMIYAGNDTFIDAFSPPSSAPLTPQQREGTDAVREMTGAQFLGKSFEEMQSGETLGYYTVYFGTLFDS